MLPGRCSFRHIFMCASGISAHGKTSDMHGSMRFSTMSLLAWEACIRLAKWTLDAFLAHPDIAGIESEIEARRAGAENDHAAALHNHARDREGRLAGMLKDEVDIITLAGRLQIALPNLRASFIQVSYSGVLTVGICPQQSKSLRLITPFGAKVEGDWRFDSSEMMPIAFAPATAQIWIARTQGRRMRPRQAHCGRDAECAGGGQTASGRWWRG